MSKDYKTVFNEAVEKADQMGRDIAIMKNAFGEFTTFIASDPSDYAKYEIVRPGTPKMLQGGTMYQDLMEGIALWLQDGAPEHDARFLLIWIRDKLDAAGALPAVVQWINDYRSDPEHFARVWDVPTVADAVEHVRVELARNQKGVPA